MKTMVAGYHAGRANQLDIEQAKDKAWTHGYLNGQVDGGHAKGSKAQSDLARLYVARGKLG